MTTKTTVRCADCGATATMPPLPATLSHSCGYIPHWTVEPQREGGPARPFVTFPIPPAAPSLELPDEQ